MNTKRRQLTSENQEPVSRNPEVVSGTAVFPGTRVPVGILFEHLADGDSIFQFMQQFPTVSQTQIIAVLDYTRKTFHKDDSWYSLEDSAG